MSTNIPVILNITNNVVQAQTANALLAIGASPIMSNSCVEIDDILNFTSAVNINVGTLHSQQIKLFHHTLKLANKKNIPVALDPVGFGATQLRNSTVINLLNEYQVSLIKGNADEVLALANNKTEVSNTIDSHHQSTDALKAAKWLSHHYQTTVVITGKTDFCIEGEQLIEVNGGHEMMSKVTGMGCITNAVISSLLNRYSAIEASEHGLNLMARAGEKAGEKAAGPGTFMMYFIDELYLLTP